MDFNIHNNTIIQYGVTNATSYTFPIAFTKTVCMAECRTRGGADSGTHFQIDSLSLTGFKSGYDGSQKLYYIAIGY